MNTVTHLLTVVAKVYEFVGRVLTIALGWAILWSVVQLLAMLAQGL
ncbi:hypothetical protein AB0G05_19690 [Nonomuraea wenchangensis]